MKKQVFQHLKRGETLPIRQFDIKSRSAIAEALQKTYLCYVELTL